MSEAGERRRPFFHAYTEHIPNPFVIWTLAILGPSLALSSVTTIKKSSDLVSYAISKAPAKHQQPNNQKSRHTEKNRLWKSEYRGRSCTQDHLESPNTRTTRFETDFKTLIKKLGNWKKIVTQGLDKRNTLKSHILTHHHRAHWKHSTFPIVPKSVVLFGHHRGEAGEPPSISGHVSRETGVNQP
jgi:hypothetical protein